MRESNLELDVPNGATRISLRCAFAALSVLLLGLKVWAQLPPAQKLSVEDEREFKKELERLETLPSANNRPAIELQIANTYVAGGQYSEAMQRPRKLVRQILDLILRGTQTSES